MPTVVKPGFSGPLKIDVELDLKSLRGLLAKHAPIGKTRPSGFTVGGKKYTYREKPQAPGRLRKSFFLKGAVRLNRKKTGVLIHSDLPYARIQDKGGKIPAHTQPAGAKKMMFKAGGKLRFVRHRKGFRLKGTDYTKAAVEEWRTRRGIKAGIKVRWAPHKKGAKPSEVAEALRTPGGL